MPNGALASYRPTANDSRINAGRSSIHRDPESNCCRLMPSIRQILFSRSVSSAPRGHVCPSTQDKTGSFKLYVMSEAHRHLIEIITRQRSWLCIIVRPHSARGVRAVILSPCLVLRARRTQIRSRRSRFDWPSLHSSFWSFCFAITEILSIYHWSSSLYALEPDRRPIRSAQEQPLHRRNMKSLNGRRVTETISVTGLNFNSSQIEWFWSSKYPDQT